MTKSPTRISRALISSTPLIGALSGCATGSDEKACRLGNEAINGYIDALGMASGDARDAKLEEQSELMRDAGALAASSDVERGLEDLGWRGVSMVLLDMDMQDDWVRDEYVALFVSAQEVCRIAGFPIDLTD